MTRRILGTHGISPKGYLSALQVLRNDTMLTMAGGDGMNDIVIPDTHEGFGSNLPGGA